MSKVYILQKDFGLIKAGEEIYWNSGYGKYYGRTYKHNHSECLSFTQEEIDRNPDWFKLIEENKPKYNANFLWGFPDNSIEAIGYEFANAKTEGYQKECWDELIRKVKENSSSAPQPQKEEGDLKFQRVKGGEEFKMPLGKPEFYEYNPEKSKPQEQRIEVRIEREKHQDPRILTTDVVIKPSTRLHDKWLPLIKESVESLVNDEHGIKLKKDGIKQTFWWLGQQLIPIDEVDELCKKAFYAGRYTNAGSYTYRLFDDYKKQNP